MCSHNYYSLCCLEEVCLLNECKMTKDICDEIAMYSTTIVILWSFRASGRILLQIIIEVMIFHAVNLPLSISLGFKKVRVQADPK